MAYVPRVGSRVRYRSASGRVRVARVTAVGAAGALDLRVGSAKSNGAAVAGAAKRTGKGSTAGWLRGGR